MIQKSTFINENTRLHFFVLVFPNGNAGKGLIPRLLRQFVIR